MRRHDRREVAGTAASGACARVKHRIVDEREHRGVRVETKIRGDLIALERQVRSQVESLRDELLGRYAANLSELLVELGEEQQPGFPKSYNCAITVTTGPGDRISSRCRERVIGNALRKGFEAVALDVKRSLRRRLVPAPELAA
jgi:hypothetical protein